MSITARLPSHRGRFLVAVLGMCLIVPGATVSAVEPKSSDVFSLMEQGKLDGLVANGAYQLKVKYKISPTNRFWS